jgi:hypothetical protein
MNQDSDFKFTVMQHFGKPSSFIDAFSTNQTKVLEFAMLLHSQSKVTRPKVTKEKDDDLAMKAMEAQMLQALGIPIQEE